MKSFIIGLLILIPVTALSQTDPDIQLYNVHDDQVKPHQLELYEETAKKLADGLTEYDVDASYFVVEREDIRFLYFRPVRGLGYLGENTWGKLRPEMPEEYAVIAADFTASLDAHGSYILELHKQLSYRPELEGSQRRLIYLHVSPDQEAAFLRLAGEIRRLFESNNVNARYRVYKSGYGNRKDYFVVEITPEDAEHVATSINEFQEYRYRVLQHLMRAEVFNVTLRDDLSYQKANWK